jgi:hypothetical protein
MPKPRLRSPSYPSLTIDDAIDRAKNLYAKEGRHPALVSTAVSHWGYKQKSSGGLKTVASLKSYGLLADEGNGADRTIRLTDSGLAIVQDERAISPGRDEFIQAAAFKPKILSDMWAKYGESLPSLDTVKHYLTVERGYNPNAFSDIIRSYKAAVSYRTTGIAKDIDNDQMESIADSNVGKIEHSIPHKVAQDLIHVHTHGEEIANIRVSRNCTIRLIADGEYNKKSIEALIAQLKLGLELGTFDDLNEEEQ